MRIEYIAGRCKFSAQSLATTGLYTHFNFKNILNIL
jgi:hypothetical protein